MIADTRDSGCRASGAIAASSLISTDEWRSMAASLGLTTQEFEIVRCIFDNGCEVSIAETLGISRHTVHTHLNRLYPKLEVNTQSGLILRAFMEYVALKGQP